MFNPEYYRTFAKPDECAELAKDANLLLEIVKELHKEIKTMVPFVDANYHEHEMPSEWIHISPDGFSLAEKKAQALINKLEPVDSDDGEMN